MLLVQNLTERYLVTVKAMKYESHRSYTHQTITDGLEETTPLPLDKYDHSEQLFINLT